MCHVRDQGWSIRVLEVRIVDIKRQRLRSKYDQIAQLEERIDYLEGVIYQMFQLVEKLLKTLEYQSNETAQSSRDTEKIFFIDIF